MNVKASLREKLQQCQVAPFLFIGSGLSRRYLGLEMWADLLKVFTDETTSPFEYYLSSANDNLPQVATLLAKEYHELWWKNEKFRLSREANSIHAKSVDAALKIEISRYVEKKIENITTDEELLLEIELLKRANIDGVITTNWDYFLETIFPDFEVYIGQTLLFSRTHAIGETYKIHGCCSQPSSLVLTSEDYADYNRKNPYLVAKLLTVFIEHPVIFLGYSLADQNVQQILASIALCLNPAEVEKLKDRLIFVSYEPEKETTITSRNFVITEGRSLPLTVIEASNFAFIYEVLCEVPRKFPAQLLRQLKAQVTEIVLTQDPQNKLQAVDMKDDVKASEIEVVFGVGLLNKIGKVGLKGLHSSELLQDVLFDDRQFSAEDLLTEVLPDLLKASTNVPIFKYLRQAGRLSNSHINLASLDSRVVKASKKTHESFRGKSKYEKRVGERVRRDFQGVSDLAAKQGNHLRCLWHIPFFDKESIDLDELRSFLHNFQRLENYGEQAAVPTNFRKLVCFYDYLRYGPEAATSTYADAELG